MLNDQERKRISELELLAKDQQLQITKQESEIGYLREKMEAQQEMLHDACIYIQFLESLKQQPHAE